MKENLEKILSFLENTHAFYYATCTNNLPRVRPFGSVMEYEDRLYIGMGDYKESYRQTKENPNIEICSCTDGGKWIRIRGKAVEDRRAEVMNRVFELEPHLHSIYNEQNERRMANFWIDEGYCEITDLSDNF
ncbi:MAG: pyridoxamine 5'-phosphate oxidase family protein, partial [Oscillospiraceae bacterium]